MKLSRVACSILIRQLLLAVGIVWLAGCATTPKVDWNSRIGHFTHDQAVLELGPPDRTATLTDGSRVVEWLVSRGGVTTFREHEGPYYWNYYGGHYISRYSTVTTPDYYLRLTFGPDGQLQSWKELAR